MAFVGDGGFFYHATELETAARCGINAVIMVNNNYSLSQDMRAYDTAYGDKREAGLYQWQFSKSTNLVALAESLGCVGMCVDSPADLQPTLKNGSGCQPTGADRRAHGYPGHGASRLDRGG